MKHGFMVDWQVIGVEGGGGGVGVEEKGVRVGV